MSDYTQSNRDETDIEIVEAELRRERGVPTMTAGEWLHQHEKVLALQAELDELREAA